MEHSVKEYVREHASLFDPHEAELALLHLHEQGVHFEVRPPVGISEGRQSRVSILEYCIDGQAHQVLWKRMGAGKGLSREEAEMFERRLRFYRKELLDAGWHVPELFYTTTAEIDGEHQILSYEQLVGRGDGDIMLSNPEEPHFRKWHLLRRVAETLAAYPRHTLVPIEVAGIVMHRLPHGLDMKLANVVLDEQGMLWFVDLFGPKEINEKTGAWRTYSQKLDTLPEGSLMGVCATREGMLLRMYRLAQKVWSATKTIDAQQLNIGFVQLLESLGLPDDEAACIIDQIKSGFPWLDRIYEEKKV